MQGNDTLAYAAFAAKMAGMLGVFSGTRELSASPYAVAPHTAMNALLMAPAKFPQHFDLSKVDKLPSVVTHTCRPDDSLNRQKSEIERRLKLDTASAIESKTHGEYRKVLIVEGFGNGMIPEKLKPFLKDLDDYLEGLADQGVLVIRTSQVPEGEITDRPEDRENKFINGGHLRADSLGLFTKFYLATARSEQRDVTHEDLRNAVRLIQPAPQTNTLS